MNTSNYILQRNNQTVVNLRPIHERMGFTPAEFPSWFKDRIKKMHLTEGKDFEMFSENRHYQYVVPPAIALQILNTVPQKRAEVVKKELYELLPGTTPLAAESTATPPSLGLFNTEAVKPEVVKLTGPIGVLQIEGRSAVSAQEMFLLWSTPGISRLNEWVQRRIVKHDLIVDRDYVEYKGIDPITFRKTNNFIFSIDTAILVAKGEVKGKGKPVADYLTEFRKDLKKQKLPSKGKLSDFIGLKPVNVAAVEPEILEPVNDSTEEIAAQAPVLTNPVPVGSVSPQPVADGINGQPGEKQNEEEGRTDGEFAESQEPNTPLSENTETQMNEPEPSLSDDEGVPNIFDLMVQFAQVSLQQAQTLLQHAHALADQQSELRATSGTLSVLVGIDQEAGRLKAGLHRPGEGVLPTVTLRDKINYAVSKRATATGEKHEEIFKMIYARLAHDYGFSVLAYPREKNESHLGLCQRIGILDKVWAIVDSRAFNNYVAATRAAA
jgi:phage anti-repressor protein